MDETNVLVPNYLDLINQTKPAEIIPQLLFGRVLIQTTEIHISTGVALLDRQSDLAWDGRRFSPADLQFLAMQRQFLDDRVGVELSSGRSVQERQEDTRFLRENSDRFKRTEVNEVEEFVNRSGCGKIPNVDGASGGGVRGTESNLKGSRRILCLFDRVSDHKPVFKVKTFLPGSCSSGYCMGIPPWFRERSCREYPCLACCSRNRGMESWHWH